MLGLLGGLGVHLPRVLVQPRSGANAFGEVGLRRIILYSTKGNRIRCIPDLEHASWELPPCFTKTLRGNFAALLRCSRVDDQTKGIMRS